MKIYLATHGWYSDYTVLKAFTRREDAEAYELADAVEELDLSDGPAEVRDGFYINWRKGDEDPGRLIPARQDSDDYPQGVVSRFSPCGNYVHVHGWDADEVLAEYERIRSETESA